MVGFDLSPKPNSSIRRVKTLRAFALNLLRFGPPKPNSSIRRVKIELTIVPSSNLMYAPEAKFQYKKG